MNTDEFVEAVNRSRLASNGHWYQWSSEVNGKTVQIKAYKTWLQILRVDGINHAGLGDVSVKVFKETLRQAVQ